ncbi:MAG: tRNA (adenosine(37)-N6)-dimethylallyltransferase MiaA, partial [Terrimicrobiaceae bacterium]
MPNPLTSVARSDPLSLNNNSQSLRAPERSPVEGIVQTPEGSHLLVIAGPTGAGKSEFACELASRVGGEIVCADAFQVYQGMPVLTAQPGPSLSEKVPHHLYSVVPPSLSFDAASYACMAREKIAEIAKRGKEILLVGGSGLYLRALFGGLDEAPAPDPALRASLGNRPLQELLEDLEKADPHALTMIDWKNPRRVLRALEIVTQTGKPLADSRKNAGCAARACRGFLLTREPGELKARISRNVESMFQAGVVNEVMSVTDAGPTASRAIGFEEIRRHARGEL